MEEEYRAGYRAIQTERGAQEWGGLFAVIAAGTAAWFVWSLTMVPVIAVLVSIPAAFLGYGFGYKFAKLFSMLLLLAILVAGVSIFIGAQVEKKTQEGVAYDFDPKSLNTTLLWMKAKSQMVADAGQKRNEGTSREALEALNRELAKAEGAQVQWDVLAESVTPASVTLQPIIHPLSVTFEAFAGSKDPANAESTVRRILPITIEQSRKLVGGAALKFTGRVVVCRAERAGQNLVFTLRVTEARVVD